MGNQDGLMKLREAVYVRFVYCIEEVAKKKRHRITHYSHWQTFGYLYTIAKRLVVGLTRILYSWAYYRSCRQQCFKECTKRALRVVAASLGCTN